MERIIFSFEVYVNKTKVTKMIEVILVYKTKFCGYKFIAVQNMLLFCTIISYQNINICPPRPIGPLPALIPPHPLPLLSPLAFRPSSPLLL